MKIFIYFQEKIEHKLDLFKESSFLDKIFKIKKALKACRQRCIERSIRRNVHSYKKLKQVIKI